MKFNNRSAKHNSKDKAVSSAAIKPNKVKALHETRIDVSEKVRIQVCEILNQALAESLDLMTQTKQAHWNVKGVHFYQLHLLFDEMACELVDYVDLFAERITTYGGTAFGTIRMAAKASNLPEYPTDLTEGLEHVVALAERYAQFGATLRKFVDRTGNLGDSDTQDIFIEVSRNTDKRLWFLEAHLQAASSERETRHAHVAARPKR